MAEKNRFAELRGLDVSGMVETVTTQRKQFKYVSWANAWDMLMKRYPDSFSTVYKDERGRIYHDDGRGAWVEVGVTLVDGDYRKELVEVFPVMDKSFRAIPVDHVTVTDVNNSIQRATAKAIARHGIGLALYTGEDIPEPDAQESTAAPAAPPAPPAPAMLEAPACEECGAILHEVTGKNGKYFNPAALAGISRKKYGRVLCPVCMKDQHRAISSVYGAIAEAAKG